MGRDTGGGRAARRAVLAAIGASLSGSLPLFLTAAVAPLLATELALSPSRFGLAVASFNVALTGGALTIAHRVDGMGWRTGIRVSAMGSAVSMAGIGLAGDWRLLCVFLAVGGASHAIAQAAANLALVGAVEPRQAAFMFGVKQTAPVIRTTLSGLAVPLVAASWGWRAAYAFALSAPFLALFAVPVQPSGNRVKLPRRPTNTPPSRAQLMLGVLGVLAGATVTVLATFLVSSAVADGISPAAAGSFLAVASVGSIASRLAVGAIASRGSIEPLHLMSWMLSAGVAGYFLLASGHVAGVVLGGCIAFAAGYGWPGLFHFVASTVLPGKAAASTGYAVAGLAIGSLVGPLAFGLVVEHRSYALAWALTAAVALTAAAVCRVARRTSGTPLTDPFGY